jgi:hypothetical protein
VDTDSSHPHPNGIAGIDILLEWKPDLCGSDEYVANIRQPCIAIGQVNYSRGAMVCRYLLPRRIRCSWARINDTFRLGIHILAEALVRNFGMQPFDTTKTLAHIPPAEAIILYQSGVLIEVIPWANRPTAEIDRSTPAESFTTRIVDSLPG